MVRLNPIRVISIILVVIIFFCINFAHNTSNISVGYYFGIHYDVVDETLFNEYEEILNKHQVAEIKYYRPIWFWDYVFLKKLSINTIFSEHFFIGDFFGKSEPLYVYISYNGSSLTFVSFGGNKSSKNSKDVQLEYGIRLLSEATSKLSTKMQIK